MLTRQGDRLSALTAYLKADHANNMIQRIPAPWQTGAEEARSQSLEAFCRDVSESINGEATHVQQLAAFSSSPIVSPGFHHH
jgi:hypothetical protein